MIGESQVPRAVKQMRWGMLLIGTHFAIPAISYIVDPDTAIATVSTINRSLGGEAWSAESGHLWHMLAVGNVATLAFLCFLIRSDVVRFLPALPALFFLKMFSAVYSLFIGTTGVPVFFGVFLLDSITASLMVALCLRAAHALAKDQSAPWWARWIMIDPEAIERSLELVRAQGTMQVPNLWQVFLGSRAMWHRILFRSETVGTCADPVRSTWRARALHHRAVRLPFLFWHRAIAPLDPSGLSSTPRRVIHHLLSAHHDVGQPVYDLELLALHEGALEELRRALVSVVDGTHPRATWLKDLCVHERYHERLLADVDAKLAGVPLPDEVARNPDASLTGTLAWCASQPSTPAATRDARAAGAFRARFV